MNGFKENDELRDDEAKEELRFFSFSGIILHLTIILMMIMFVLCGFKIWGIIDLIKGWCII